MTIMVFAELVGKIYGAKRGLQRGIDHLVDELYCFTLSNLDPGTRHIDEGVIRTQVKRTWGTPGKAFLADIRNMTESVLKLLAIYSAKRGYALYHDPSKQSRLDDYMLAAFATNDFREMGRSLQKASDIYGVLDSIILPTKNETAVLRRVRALTEEYEVQRHMKAIFSYQNIIYSSHNLCPVFVNIP